LSVMSVVSSIAREILDAFFMNYFFIFLYVIIIIFIRAQYEKYSELQGEIYGSPVKSMREITEEIILTGLLAGFAGSLITVASGITLDPVAVRYLFYIMCLLLLINIRFLCISYAGGLLSALILIFNYPRTDVSSILGLVAVLHIIESLLIYLNRGNGSIPVFIKHRGDISGAYIIRRFWLVPVVFLTFVAQSAAGGLPDFSAALWMPFKAEVARNGAYALGLDCLVAVMCYSDLAVTKQPERKSRETSYRVLVYGLVLLAVAIFSMRVQWLKYAGVVFCVAAHEGIYLYGKYSEKKGTPLFNQVRRGLRILEVLPGSHAEKMGIHRGDVILSVNGRDIQTDGGVNAALENCPTFVWISLKTWEGSDKTLEYWCYPDGCGKLGVISVPREIDVTYNISRFEHMSIIKNIVTRFRGMNRPV
jgi:hypothetical protein